MWKGLIQSAEGLKSKDRFPEEGIQPQNNINCYLNFQATGLPYGFQA